jgi:hypothetical protein
MRFLTDTFQDKNINIMDMDIDTDADTDTVTDMDMNVATDTDSLSIKGVKTTKQNKKQNNRSVAQLCIYATQLSVPFSWP